MQYKVNEGKFYDKKDDEFVNVISYVEKIVITLDDNVPEYISNLRIGSVISYNMDESIKFNHQELVNDVEFNNEIDIVNYVAEKLKISTSIIEIES